MPNLPSPELAFNINIIFSFKLSNEVSSPSYLLSVKKESDPPKGNFVPPEIIMTFNQSVIYLECYTSAARGGVIRSALGEMDRVREGEGGRGHVKIQKDVTQCDTL